MEVEDRNEWLRRKEEHTRYRARVWKGEAICGWNQREDFMEEGAFQQDYERGVELERGRIWGGAFQWSAQYEGERGGREHARMAGCSGRTGVSQEYQAKHPWALSGRQGEPAKGFEQGS